jgi:hypothetical protein
MRAEQIGDVLEVILQVLHARPTRPSADAVTNGE